MKDACSLAHYRCSVTQCQRTPQIIDFRRDKHSRSTEEIDIEVESVTDDPDVSANLKVIGKGATLLIRIANSIASIRERGDHLGGALPGRRYADHESEMSLKGMRILVVDDDRNTRDMLSEVLGLYDAEVKTAESVATALQLYETWKPSLLVSDLGMPEQDGYDLIRCIRALPGGSTTKAIAITGFLRDEDRDFALAAGFDLFLTKPVDLDKLVNLIITIN